MNGVITVDEEKDEIRVRLDEDRASMRVAIANYDSGYFHGVKDTLTAVIAGILTMFIAVQLFRVRNE